MCAHVLFASNSVMLSWIQPKFSCFCCTKRVASSWASEITESFYSSKLFCFMPNINQYPGSCVQILSWSLVLFLLVMPHACFIRVLDLHLSPNLWVLSSSSFYTEQSDRCVKAVLWLTSAIIRYLFCFSYFEKFFIFANLLFPQLLL